METRKIRVMIIDDEKIIRDFFKRLLGMMGAEAVDFDDGAKAAEAVAAGSVFDLYFIDVRMPGIDGLETYRRIKAAHPQAFAVMMTGYAVEDLLESALREGAYGAIRKPFDINQVKDIIEKAGAAGKAKASVLVVDDDESVLKFFAGLLESRGLRYRLAQSRAEALELARGQKFDLVFLDLMLKEASGKDVYAELKSVSPGSTVVLITGHPQEAKKVLEQIELAGCLYKPFELEGVLKYIEEARAKIAKIKE